MHFNLSFTAESCLEHLGFKHIVVPKLSCINDVKNDSSVSILKGHPELSTRR